MFKPTLGHMAAALAVFLFFSNQVFAINRVVSSAENLDINISLESSTSTISINSGGILNANIIMGNAAQTTILNGGTLNGNVSGAGKMNVNSSSVLNGNVNISGVVAIANGANLDINGGGISASIRGAADNVGAVKFNSNNTLLASLGTATTTLALVEIANNITLNTADKTIDALAVKIGSGATLNYGGADIIGNIQGSGSFVFQASDTTKFNIVESLNDFGQTEKLSEIKINNGATINLGGDITANVINIGNGSGGSLKSNGHLVLANNINVTSGATFDIDLNSTIAGAINGAGVGVGTVEFSNTKNDYVVSQIFGANNTLAEIIISNETALATDNNTIFNANSISIGEGGTAGLIAPVLTQNGGTVGADSNSSIKLNTNAIFNYNGGTINGEVRGTSSGKGEFNINSNYTNNLKIGAFGSLSNLNIASGKTLTANADIAANNIAVAGDLNLSSSSKIITGNIATVGGAATIDLGSFGHTISGNFSTLSGDILKINAINDSKIGNLQIAGSALIADGVALKIAFDSNDGYLANGAKINLISANSGAINVINDIDVNSSGSNQAGLLAFRTEKSDNNLLLVVDRKSAKTFSDNQFVSKIYNSIDQVGSSATGELRDLQKLIDNVAITNQTRESALKSITPQNNHDLNISSFNSAKSSVNIVDARLGKAVLNIDNQSNIKHHPLNFGDDKIFDSQSIWLQGFSTSAAQENVGDNDGYNYSNNGLVIGVDQEVADNLRLGISSSFSTGKAKSNSANQKQTDIDSYQFNLYGAYNFAPYFFSSILGVAINKYNSLRSMPELALQAKASYGGETYIAKFETGMIKKFDDFIITPKLSLTAARNQIDTYAESGAGTLNLKISNEHSDFLEGRIGGDLIYQASELIQPKLKLSYGYDFLSKDQSSTNRFQDQNSSFQIKNSNIDQVSLKYGFGLDVYADEGVLLVIDYDAEVKASYKSKTGSIYLRYDF